MFAETNTQGLAANDKPGIWSQALQTLSNAIVNGLVSMGGDPLKAARNARKFNVLGWKVWQSSQVGLIGALSQAPSVAIWGSHLPFIAVDLVALLEKLAYVCWGIGGIYGFTFDDEQGREEARVDFELILGHWAGAITADPVESVIELNPQKGDQLSTTIAFVLVPSAGIASASASGTLTTASVTSYLTTAFPQLAGKKVSEEVVKVGVAAFGKKLGAKSSIKVGALAAPFAAMIAEKVAGKFAAKSAIFAAVGKITTNAATGFVPIAGSVIGGGVNVYIITTLCHSADVYYRRKRELKDSMRVVRNN